MDISVIIPTLNEAATIGETLRRLRSSGSCEVIVVDGGSDDGTPELARPQADLVLSAGRGRATQMNVGAQAASGQVLLFLHADTVLPPDFPALLENALRNPRVVGGRFDVRLDTEGRLFRIIETLMNLRSRLSRIATGDQAIFVRSRTFQELGGYREAELMEDLELSYRLKRQGELACLRERVVTSARRWQRDGIVRTIVLMWLLRFLYFIGVSPSYLKTFYADTR
jgi:rSAM/selenodomain-associated transferase 2